MIHLAAAPWRLVAGGVLAWACLVCPAIVLAHDGEDHGSKGSPGGELEGGPLGGEFGGTIGPYKTYHMTLHSRVPLATMGGGIGNDIWGWTDHADPNDVREYALVGRSNGTSFVDVTDPGNPVYVGKLNSTLGQSDWRDIKVFSDHAFIVADQINNHGMQVFDLTQLRNFAGTPLDFSAATTYHGISRAHNLAINEETGYAYVVGSNVASGGLHIVDINNPIAPVAAGNFSADGYTHDTQAVVYNGPDANYFGREIAFNSNEDTLTIVDVTNKAATQQVSRTGYPNARYMHQGWLTEDHRFFLSDDELDEMQIGSIPTTRTHIWDVENLASPVYLGFHEHETTAIDHNLYTKGDLAFLANYTAGLRVLDISDIANVNLNEIAYIDTFPAYDSINSFNGIWSSYPYFESGTIVLGDRNSGLLVVQLHDPPPLGEFFNGDFQNGTLAGWTHGGAGTVDRFDLGGDEFAARLTTGSEVILSQQVDTPLVSFPFNYEYRFTTVDGSGTETLDVYLNGVLIDSLFAPLTPDALFTQRIVSIVDPALFGLTDVTLAFHLNGPTGTQLLLDNISGTLDQNSAAVPEPSMFALLAALLLCASGWRLLSPRKTVDH